MKSLILPIPEGDPSYYWLGKRKKNYSLLIVFGKPFKIGESMAKKSGKMTLKIAGNYLNLTIEEASEMTLVELVELIKKLSGSVVAQAEKEKKK